MNAAAQRLDSMVPPTIYAISGELEQHGMTIEEAKAIFKQRPAYDIDDWMTMLNYSAAAYILGHDSLALEMAQRVVVLQPCAPAYINLAVIHSSWGQFSEALTYAELAYHDQPDNRTAVTLYAECLLRAGRWREAWPLFHNYYDMNRVTLFRHVMKQWTHEPLKGKRLLLIEGGGFGDNFCFLRWVWDLKRRGAHITFLCPKSMMELMLQQPYIDAVIPTSEGEVGVIPNPSQYDYFAPLLSLGDCFSAEAKDAWDGPYIGAVGGDDLDLNRPLRIGFCWQAGERGLPRPFRSLDGADESAIEHTINHIHAECVSLVPGASNKQLLTWADTAYVIRSCDLIVTVDTGVAHLAGAMGRPTWVILPGFSAWYYLTGEGTPLYPYMRLFRNPVQGIGTAMHECIKALRGLQK